MLVTFSVAVGLFLPILLDGIERKLRAAVQSRVGPSILQTLYDIVKLSSKEYKPLHTEQYVVYGLVSYLVFAITSIVFATLYSTTQDTVYLVYATAFFAISASLHTAVPLLVPNPFSQIGAWREIMVAILNEAVFLVSVGFFIFYTSLSPNSTFQLVDLARLILTLALLVLSGYVATGRPPFDIAEAEPELASGVFVEFSGPILAANIYALLMKRFAVKVLIASILSSLIGALTNTPTLLLVYVLVVALWVLFTLAASILGRTRVDIGPLSLAKIYGVLILPLIVITIL